MTRGRSAAANASGRRGGGAWRCAVAAVGTAVLFAGATACGSGDHDGDRDRRASPTTTAPAPSRAAEEKSGGGTPRCAARDLTVAVERRADTADGPSYELALKNRTNDACTLKGYPRVSLAAKDGSAIGKAATHDGGTGKTVVLQPSTRALSTLRTADGPCLERPHSVKVYPPGSGQPLIAETDEPRVCGGKFTVTALKW
ncbi:DUF4232 domain-containing protein [Streptomyces oryzae]|uniref:DUF4232 domain-containing protein n=1 Tax=Streptomyces oryzae TaxID=1434886 RepID=A0ABS3XDH0_9ACTN|nr:DUF4232 domain-containing protein [Streptomyces oryzae]MBO8193409.1 DUF4232 domain-containing protein [Streptomyces oryzae]